MVHREDRDGRAGGGCVLAIKDTIPQIRRDLRKPGASIQVIQVDILLPNIVSVICVYRCPTASNEESANLLQLLSEAVQKGHRWVIVGDFNAPHIDWVTQVVKNSSTFDEDLLDWTENVAACQHVCEPTRFRNGCMPSLLDLLLTPFVNDLVSLAIRPPMGKSDHAVIVATVRVRCPKPERKLVRRYGQMNADDVVAHARRLSWLGVDIEERWLAIKSNVTLLERAHVPLVKTKGCNSRPWYCRKVRTWANKKRQAWVHYKSRPNHKSWQAYKRARNTSIAVTRQGRYNFEKKLVVNARHNPKKLHGYVQSNARLRHQVPRVITTQDGTADNDNAIANEMRRYFLSVFRPDNGATPSSVSLASPRCPMVDFTISLEETKVEL